MAELEERVALALSQSKRLEREARLLKGMLKGIETEIANLKPESGQEESNAAKQSQEQGRVEG
jgi:hypothetical protein